MTAMPSEVQPESSTAAIGGTDEDLDALADESLAVGAGPDAAPALIAGLRAAQGPLTKRAMALALAACAALRDRGAADTLLEAYRASTDDPFLGPSLLDALGVLAAKGGSARAATIAELLRLEREDERYLLVRAAKVAGRLDSQRPEPDLRQQLAEWAQADDMAVQGEARTQLALIRLADTLLAEDDNTLRDGLAAARGAFASAEATEEHRPDAATFARLIDALLALIDLPDGPDAAARRVSSAASEVRALLMGFARHDWYGYGSPRDEAVAARVLATVGALEAAAAHVSAASRWVRLDSALIELVMLYLLVRGVANRADRLDDAIGSVADIVLAPSVGPLLRRYIGRVRLDAILQQAIDARGPDDPVVHGLRTIAGTVADEPRESLSPEAEASIATLAERAGQTPSALLIGLRDALKQDRLNAWAAGLGLPTVVLPIDLAGILGDDPTADDVARVLLQELRQLLGAYPRETWDHLRAAVVGVLRFARHTRDVLPDYMRCSDDGGLGQRASERDLQRDVFRWLEAMFGQSAVYERQPLAGGRPDTGLRLGRAEFPIEVKHELSDVSRDHIRASYLSQSDSYASARDGVAFLLILDLRASLAAAHRRQRTARRRVGDASMPFGLYSLREGFWVDVLPPDPQVAGATAKPVLVGLFPGNQPLPSSTTTYSRSPSSGQRART